MLGFVAFAFSLLVPTLINAHMSIIFPLPYQNPTNKFATKPNYDINSPISASQWPCSGGSGPSVATLKAGEKSNIKFSGGAAHDGGSCQVALSYDDQKTFYVIHSFLGGCPVGEGTLEYTVPSDAPAGDATFAWVWHNKLGNREVYANCAGVTVEAGSGATPSVAFKERPDLFVANLDNGCTVLAGTDANYPNPGPDVTGSASGEPITGCSPINGIGNTVRGSDGSGGSAPPQSDPVEKPTPSLPPNDTQPSTPDSTAPIPSSTGISPAPINTAPSSPSELPFSEDGTCGPKLQCRPGFCCSSAGFCGNSELHCKGTNTTVQVKRLIRAPHGRFVKLA